jgi:hypothetical protein
MEIFDDSEHVAPGVADGSDKDAFTDIMKFFLDFGAELD